MNHDEIEWVRKLSSYYNFYSEVTQILNYMSIRKIYNRVNEYANAEYNGSINETWIAFKDYITIRAELGYDMTNSVYLHPHSLKSAHAEMVAERERIKDNEHISLKMKEFSRIPKHYKKLKKRYGMESNGYIFIPARSAEEIIIEGRTLHHCVGGDNYLKKHNDGKTAIIFMREEKYQDAPYVTIEVKDDSIIQWYGAHDKKPQDEATRNAIRDFEEYIKSKKINKSATYITQETYIAAV